MTLEADRAQDRSHPSSDVGALDPGGQAERPVVSPSPQPDPRRLQATSPLQVLLVEDSEIFAYGLANLLRRDPIVHSVTVISDAESALRLLQEQSPDVVIVGMRIRWQPGERHPGEEQSLRLLRILGETRPDLHTMVLARDIRPVLFRDLLQFRVHACLERDSSAERILAVVRAVALGFVVMEWEQLEWLRLTQNHPTLTEREREVLALAAEGLSDRQIAHRLGCSPKTASKHMEKIRAKLGVDSRTRAVAEARRLGLLL